MPFCVWAYLRGTGAVSCKTGPAPRVAAEHGRGPEIAPPLTRARRRSLPNLDAVVVEGAKGVLDAVAAHAAVKYVTPNVVVSLGETTPAAVGDEFPLNYDYQWNLARVSRPELSNEHTYNDHGHDGTGVHVYVIDTGVTPTHAGFGAPNTRCTADVTFVKGATSAVDENGHGTHCAGTIGSIWFGAAKNARIHGLQALNGDGSGQLDWIAAGMDYVLEHHPVDFPGAPAVVSMSLGGPIPTPLLDDAVQELVAAGIPTIIAAGNSNSDACMASPAREPAAFTVGESADDDSRAFFSSYGACNDILSPGHLILSTWLSDEYSTAVLSGTSMATPLVAGVTAQLLSAHPDWKPNQVYQALLDASVEGVITNALQPNFLLQNDFSGVEAVPAEDWIVTQRNPDVLVQMIVTCTSIMVAFILIPMYLCVFSIVRVVRMQRGVSYTGLDG